jgi:hypothetical protein
MNQKGTNERAFKNQSKRKHCHRIKVPKYVVNSIIIHSKGVIYEIISVS